MTVITGEFNLSRFGVVSLRGQMRILDAGMTIRGLNKTKALTIAV